jgi:hypothetical protein
VGRKAMVNNNEAALLFFTQEFVKAAVLITCTKKSDPATRHGGAWGERRKSSYSFLTSALDGGKWSASSPNNMHIYLHFR